MLVLGRQPVAVEKEEFGSEQPYARRTVLDRLLEIFGELDIGHELDATAVERCRRGRSQTAELLPFEFELVLLDPVLGKHRAIGIDDDDVAAAIDDQKLVLADQRARIVSRNDGGNVEAARDDRGVRCDPAEVGQESRKVVVLELDDIGRRQVVRDQDCMLLGVGRSHAARFAQKDLENAFDHLDDVCFALAQVRILDRLELLDEHRELLRQRPFGIAKLLGDVPLWRLAQHRIGEDHPMHVEKGAELRRGIAGGHRPVQALQLFLNRVERLRQALDLGGHLNGRDRVMRHLERRVRNELRPANGDAAGNSDTVEDEAHAARNGEGQSEEHRESMMFLPMGPQDRELVPGFMARCTATSPALKSLRKSSVTAARRNDRR